MTSLQLEILQEFAEAQYKGLPPRLKQKWPGLSRIENSRKEVYRRASAKKEKAKRQPNNYQPSVIVVEVCPSCGQLAEKREGLRGLVHKNGSSGKGCAPLWSTHWKEAQ
jgi:hypothetical protein